MYAASKICDSVYNQLWPQLTTDWGQNNADFVLGPSPTGPLRRNFFLRYVYLDTVELT